MFAAELQQRIIRNHGINLENYLLPYEPYDVNIDNTYISIIPFKFFLVDTGIEPMASNLNLEVKYCNRIDFFYFLNKIFFHIFFLLLKSVHPYLIIKFKLCSGEQKLNPTPPKRSSCLNKLYLRLRISYA